MYARPHDRPVLLAVLRAEELAALAALKLKERAEREACQRQAFADAARTAMRRHAQRPGPPRATPRGQWPRR